MKAASGRGRGWGRSTTLVVVLFVTVLLVSAIPLVRDLQLRLSDSFFRLEPRPREHSRVVVVLIDDESLRQYGRWPWSRNLLAQLTQRLSNAGPQVIGLDILLAEPQTVSADKALADTFRPAPGVVLVDKIGTYEDHPQWIEPLPIFAQAAVGIGHVQAVLDRDGVCRRFPARELTTDGSRWGFAVEVARRVDPQGTAAFLAAYGVPAQDDDGTITVAKPTLVPIAFRRDQFDTISATSVLGGADLSFMRGRPVIVGFGPTEISDRISTPLTSELPVPGVEVHAQILDSILTGRRVYQVPLWASGLLLLAVCAAVIMLTARLRGARAVLGLVGFGIAVYGGAFALFLLSSRMAPVGPSLLAILIGPLLAYSADFVVVERSVTQQLVEFQRWVDAQQGSSVRGESKDLFWRLDLLKKLQGELGAIYELHRTLLEATHDLVAIFDETGHLLLKNERFAAAFRNVDGMTIEQLRARLVSKEDAALVATATGLEGEAYLDNELYGVRITPLPPTTLSPGGGKIVTLSDLRARVERDRARAEALGFVTHELRTPLVAIQGFAQLMTEYPNSPSSATAPQTIYRESRRLLALINSYLDVLRLDAGARPMRADVVSMEEVVRQVLDILQPLAAASEMQLQLECTGPAPVIGDAPLVTGAVLNLVSNALKYGEPRSEVKVSYARENGEVVLRVQNVGDPIPSDSIPRLFDAYYRVPDSGTSENGWGLGLAFVKRIAEKHGGSVGVQSDVASTTFEIRLPAKARAATARKQT